MQFSNTTTRGGLIQDCERLTDKGVGTISGNTNELKDFTARINKALSEVFHLIFSSSGIWNFDDSNQTDLPVAKRDIVSGTDSYLLPDGITSIERIDIYDADGNTWELQQYPLYKITNGEADFLTGGGRPIYYRLFGDVVKVYPAPNYDATLGLAVYFGRELVSFSSTDTTAEPGFASPYHDILSLMASADWFIAKQPQSPTLVKLEQKLLQRRADLVNYYRRRNRGYNPRVSRAKTSNYI